MAIEIIGNAFGCPIPTMSAGGLRCHFRGTPEEVARDMVSMNWPEWRWTTNRAEIMAILGPNMDQLIADARADQDAVFA